MVAVAVAGGVGNGVGGVGPLWCIAVRSPASAITRSDVGGVKEGHRGDTTCVTPRDTRDGCRGFWKFHSGPKGFVPPSTDLLTLSQNHGMCDRFFLLPKPAHLRSHTHQVTSIYFVLFPSDSP